MRDESGCADGALRGVRVRCMKGSGCAGNVGDFYPAPPQHYASMEEDEVLGVTHGLQHRC